MTKIIDINNVSKRFGKTAALRGINISVNKSELFGLIGPDGAGKTTLLRIIATLLLPDEGSIQTLGKDCKRDYKELRSRIGYMPGRFSLYPDLTVEENLEFYATVFGASIKENYDLISDIYSHIEPFKKRPAGKLSGGMKQKLALSCALIHKPDILILDEPTTGVDAVSRSEFWDMLGRLKQHDITIIVSTPYMDEAIRCDRVALIQNGKILAIDSPRKISEGYGRKLFSIKSAQKYNLINALRSMSETVSSFPFGESAHATFIDDKIPLSISEYLKERGITDAVISEIKPDIEDRFLELMQSDNLKNA